MNKPLSKRNKTIHTSLENGQDLLKQCMNIENNISDIKSIYNKVILGDLFLVANRLPEKSVDLIIKRLKQYDLIDDEAYAYDLVEYYNSLNYGKNKIIHKLSDKGIFDIVINKMKFPISIEKKKDALF